MPATHRFVLFWSCETLLLAGALALSIYLARKGLHYIVVFIPMVIFAISLYLAILLHRKRVTTEGHDVEGAENEVASQRLGMPVKYTYEQLREATGGFRERLGGGGFGSVFKGTLENGQRIAVKRLEGVGQGNKEFVAEVKTIGSINHVNLVKLIGYCAEARHRALVYEFLCNGSLDKRIFIRGPSALPPLDWEIRKKIILDVAKGLAYLHEECRQKIVHLDIKPQNILLDANLCAKISDFGLSKLIDRDQSQVATAPRGTFGYVAPEVILQGAVSDKADIYSFGVVVLEIVCGRKNLDRTQSQDLLTILREKEEADRLVDMADQSIEEMLLHESEAVKFIKIASLCLQRDYPRRPPMSLVIMALEGALDVATDLGYGIHGEISRPLTVMEPSILAGPR